jgi:hypothetical protein
MPTPRSEVQSIIAQIRAGNNDPELLASALEAIVTNTPYSGRGYKEFMFTFRSNGTNVVTDITVINNTLDIEIIGTDLNTGQFYFEFGGLYSGFNGIGGPLCELQAFIPSDEAGATTAWLDGPTELRVINTTTSATVYGESPAWVRIRVYDNQ